MRTTQSTKGTCSDSRSKSSHEIMQLVPQLLQAESARRCSPVRPRTLLLLARDPRAGQHVHRPRYPQLIQLRYLAPTAKATSLKSFPIEARTSSTTVSKSTLSSEASSTTTQISLWTTSYQASSSSLSTSRCSSPSKAHLC